MPDVGTPRALYELYWDELKRAGAELSQFEVTTNGCVYVCEDPEQGWNDVKESLSYMYDQYEIWASEAGDVLAATSSVDASGPNDLCIVGTPTAVAERLAGIEAEFNLDRFIFWARLPGLSIEKSNRSLELFSNEVIPLIAKSS
jgi:alkanesulfonate monooxygenase SsuD/methylene tetrahydromethanopterin reductase-like flavin-dependent oxidoreductase (luciferase family)